MSNKLRIRQICGVWETYVFCAYDNTRLRRGYGYTPYKAYLDYFKPLIKQPPVIDMNNHGV